MQTQKLSTELKYARRELEYRQSKVYDKIDYLERFGPHLSEEERNERLQRCEEAVEAMEEAMDRIAEVEEAAQK